MTETMDDGELELSNDVQLLNPDSSINFQGSTSVDSFLDDLLKNTRTCTYTHTCNPPGLDSTSGAIGLRCQTNLPCSDPHAESPSQASIGGSQKWMVSWEENCQTTIIDKYAILLLVE